MKNVIRVENGSIINGQGGSGGSGGHTIQNDSGTALPQESALQFVGVYSEDDSTNGKTKVNIIREMTKAQMDALSTDAKKGVIHTTDEADNPANPISAENVTYGSGTVKDALDAADYALDRIGLAWTLNFGTYNNGSYRSKVARVGNIIFFYFSGAKNLTANTFVQVGTLPSDCPKPSSTQTVNVQYSSAYAQVAIYANGSIQVNCNEVNCYANGMMMFTI